MLKAGFASIDITPDQRLSLMGYDFRWTHLPPGNTGVLDPLAARVLALEDGGGPALLVSLDLCVIHVDLARQIRRRIAKKAGTSPDRVLVATTHTHSGPYPQLPGRKGKPQDRKQAAMRRLNEPYARLLLDRLETAAAMAAGKLHPVSVRAAQAPLGIGYNRRVKVDGKVQMCWNPLEFPDLRPQPSPDPTCTVLVFREPHGPRQYVLFSLGAHPVCLGKTSQQVSGDWPALACRMIDQHLPGTRSMFFLGACGEVHPWIATQEDPQQLVPVASAAAGMVQLLVASGAGEKQADATIRIATRTWKHGRLELDLAAWRIGPATILAAPVELFASLSAQLRARLPSPLFLVTLGNGWTGYWPDRAAFDEGQYEIGATWGLRKGDGEKLIDLLAALAGSLDAPRR